MWKSGVNCGSIVKNGIKMQFIFEIKIYKNYSVKANEWGEHHNLSLFHAQRWKKKVFFLLSQCKMIIQSITQWDLFFARPSEDKVIKLIYFFEKLGIIALLVTRYRE